MKLTSIATLAFVGLSVAGCVSDIENKGNMLSAAGFNIRVATTPKQIASLRTLPPHTFVLQTKNGRPIYLFADPQVCNCIYYGSEQNYQTYRQMVFAQNLADQQQMTAMMYQQAAFDFGPWGPGPWGPGGYWGPLGWGRPF